MTSAPPVDRDRLVESLAELRAELAEATAARDATPTGSIDRLSKVTLGAHYTGMIKLLETRLRILDAQPRA